MCNMNHVGTMAGSGGTMALASGGNKSAAPSDVAGKNGMPDAKGGGAEGAVAGAQSTTGGGQLPGSLAAVLEALKTAVTALAEAVSKMGVAGGGGKASGCGCGAGVMGVQGQAASRQQYVARTASTTRNSDSEDHQFEQRVLELINEERVQRGLRPVRYNGTLDNAAEKHADHMSIVGKMAHDGIGDGDPGERIRAEGFRNAWGENVATGQTSPEQVVREWMNSPTHRRNILDPNYSLMGVSYVTAENGRSYWAQEFGAE